MPGKARFPRYSWEDIGGQVYIYNYGRTMARTAYRGGIDSPGALQAREDAALIVCGLEQTDESDRAEAQRMALEWADLNG